MMKVIVLFLVITVVSCLPAKDWNSWKSEHGKKYKNDSEENLRKKVFERNFKEVEDHNAKFERGEVTYRKSLNKFADLTNEDVISKFTGIKMPDQLDK
uniref:CSON013185 protein n=1 Tax=Culicoides sonorensis TaxID=179676 RepID=A0A336KN08_CULSO